VVRNALLALPLLVACTGDIESKLTEGLDPKEAIAVEKWAKKALPVFTGERTKCVTCHDGTIAAAPAYLAGANDTERRLTLIDFMPRVINLSAPQSSRMLTVGDHSAMAGGPALLAPEASDCLEWFQAERAARPEIEPIRTAQLTPMLCTAGNPGDATCPINTVDLGGIGPTPVAATLTFVLQQVGSDSYYTNLKVKAGAEGVYLEHPLIESYIAGDPMPTADPVDRLFAIVLNVPADMEVPIGTGTLTVAGFNPIDPISWHFDVIEKVRPGT
jgi:hypothetical protein